MMPARPCYMRALRYAIDDDAAYYAITMPPPCFRYAAAFQLPPLLYLYADY